jgi:hypothetical protein
MAEFVRRLFEKPAEDEHVVRGQAIEFLSQTV